MKGNLDILIDPFAGSDAIESATADCWPARKPKQFQVRFFPRTVSDSCRVGKIKLMKQYLVVWNIHGAMSATSWRRNIQVAINGNDIHPHGKLNVVTRRFSPIIAFTSRIALESSINRLENLLKSSLKRLTFAFLTNHWNNIGSWNDIRNEAKHWQVLVF